MLGVTHQDGSYVNGTNFRRDGSLLSGSQRGSSFQRGKYFKMTRDYLQNKNDEQCKLRKYIITRILQLSGGSMRGSDRSMRRDIDDIALSNHFSISGSRSFTMPAAQQPLTGYGRKEMDDMVIFLINIILINEHDKAVITNIFPSIKSPNFNYRF